LPFYHLTEQLAEQVFGALTVVSFFAAGFFAANLAAGFLALALALAFFTGIWTPLVRLVRFLYYSIFFIPDFKGLSNQKRKKNNKFRITIKSYV